MSTRETKYSVAIIGAGPAGGACALSLLQAGIGGVALIDAPKKQRFEIGESIPPDMNPMLRELGLYKAFVLQQHEPCYGSCSYWGSELRGYNDSILSPYGNAWHLDRDKFNALFVETAQARGAVLYKDCVFHSAQRAGEGHRLEVRNSAGERSSLDADFVVDASGTRAVFARFQGSAKVHDLPLVCLSLRFKAKGRLNLPGQTHLEAVEHGWWYAARIPGEQVLVGFYTDAATTRALELQKRQHWIQLLQAGVQTSQWLGRLEPADSKLWGFPAPSFCLDRIAGERWLAIGDAASTYDPITANGITKAVVHGMKAAQIIAAQFNGGALTPAAFETEVRTQHTHYCALRRDFYRMEQRWPHSAFWRNVHSL